MKFYDKKNNEIPMDHLKVAKIVKGEIISSVRAYPRKKYQHKSEDLVSWSLWLPRALTVFNIPMRHQDLGQMMDNLWLDNI